ESAEAVSFARGVLDTVAAQPADEENYRDFATEIFWPADKGAQLVATAVAGPIVQDFGIREMLAGTILLRASNGRQAQRPRGADRDQASKHIHLRSKGTSKS